MKQGLSRHRAHSRRQDPRLWGSGAVLLAALPLCSVLTSCRTAANGHVASSPFQYEREIRVGGRATGQSCVVLDGAVFAHAAAAAANDLRLYAGSGGAAQEIPYALTESAAEPGEVDTPAVEGERVSGNAAEFDLPMPARPFSEIDLQTPLRDFIAVAEVTGAAAKGAPGKALGTVTIFDFSGQGLPRSTALRLGESSWPWVHVKLRVFNTRGTPVVHLQAPVVSLASVPPSREAQVRYTVVSETQSLWPARVDEAVVNGARVQSSPVPLGRLQIEAHVPVERVRLELDPAYKADFGAKLTLAAKAQTARSTDVPETYSGAIGRVIRERPAPGAPPIRFEQLSVPVSLGANLRDDANVAVTSDKDQFALPVRAIVLEMRQRSLCFDAAAGAHYTLRYGNPELLAPAYAYARSFQPQAHPVEGLLGAEGQDPRFVPKTKTSLRERSPEWFWVLLVAVVGLGGAATVERMRHTSRHSRGR